MHAEARRAAFVPEGSGLLGHALGSVTAALTFPEKGLVPGRGADAKLSRAQYHLDAGKLADAVKSIQVLPQPLLSPPYLFLSVGENRSHLAPTSRLD